MPCRTGELAFENAKLENEVRLYYSEGVTIPPDKNQVVTMKVKKSEMKKNRNSEFIEA
jgi:hypothetical protein